MPAQPHPQIRYFRVTGLDCAEEVTILKNELGPLVGSSELLSFDVLNNKLGVNFPDDSLSTESIQAAIKKTGMRAEPWIDKPGSDPQQSGFWEAWQRTVLTTVSGVATALGWAMQLVPGEISGLTEAATGDSTSILEKCLFGIAMLAGSWNILPKAWHSFRRIRPDMNLLMVVAISGAIGIGEWLEGATVAFLFALSLLLESWSVNRARRAIGALLELAPLTARVRREDGKEDVLPPDQVVVGATIVVRPGEKIPLDGRVKEGTSHVNQAPITGESMPVVKNPGSDVFAGTINGDGVLQIESTKAASDSTLSQIIRLVGEAQMRRAPSEQWVEKFARIYTPVVMVVAVIVAFAGPVVFKMDWTHAIYQSLVFLVIACPCALVISTPVSIVAALTSSAKKGVLVKGGEFIEAPSKVRAIAFDKTGTLTEGKPVVKKVVALNGHTDTELLERASSLEQRSDHPLARAIVEYADSLNIKPTPAAEFQLIQGKGARAKFDNRDFWIGSHRYLEERKQETPDVHDQLEELSKNGHSIVVVGNENHVCGFIALADKIREDAKGMLQELKKLGVEHLIMLTGDNRATAEAVAKEIGITEFRAEMLPQDKVSAIEELANKYSNIAMIGDGVNDAPALARANIGIAMGAVGSDAAIETADVALMSDDISALPWLISHSRKTLQIIKQNIAFSLSVKAIFVALSFAGMASLWAAIAADTGASLLVIMNGLRLLQLNSPSKSS